MNFLYFVFVSLIWVSTQGGFSVLTETTETGPTDPNTQIQTQESQETPSTDPENTDPTEQITEEEAYKICEGMLSCRSDTKPFEDEKYLCNALGGTFCLVSCTFAVMDKQCGIDTACIMGKLASGCICDKDRYKHGFRCRDVTPEQTKEQKYADVCEQMDSCNQDAICDRNGNCVCPGSLKNGIACKDECLQKVSMFGWSYETLSMEDVISNDCLCKKGYRSPEVPCEVTESPTVVTTTTTEDDGIQEGWKTETNIEWLLSSLKNMQYAAWHIFKDEGFGRYGGRGGYNGYGRHGVKSQDQQEETGDSSSTATENNSGNQGNDGN